MSRSARRKLARLRQAFLPVAFRTASVPLHLAGVVLEPARSSPTAAVKRTPTTMQTPRPRFERVADSPADAPHVFLERFGHPEKGFVKARFLYAAYRTSSRTPEAVVTEVRDRVKKDLKKAKTRDQAQKVAHLDDVLWMLDQFPAEALDLAKASLGHWVVR